MTSGIFGLASKLDAQHGCGGTVCNAEQAQRAQLVRFKNHLAPIFARQKRRNPRRTFGSTWVSYGCGGGIWTSRPPGYEPDELPSCSTPRYEIWKWCRKPGSNRYDTKYHGILSPGRLPVPPFRHVFDEGRPFKCLFIIAQHIGIVNPFLQKLIDKKRFCGLYFIYDFPK